VLKLPLLLQHSTARKEKKRKRAKSVPFQLPIHSLYSFFNFFLHFSTSTLKLTFYKGKAFLHSLKALDHMQSSITHKLEDQKFNSKDMEISFSSTSPKPKV
jgi:hypothetical protein